MDLKKEGKVVSALVHLIGSVLALADDSKGNRMRFESVREFSTKVEIDRNPGCVLTIAVTRPVIVPQIMYR